jgi:DNA repair protein RecN (Recombination protein N)
MLTSLHVRNFTLIDQLVLNFGTGLNILTGETGAGKSIIIDALGIAIGERASADSVREGANKLTVEATFTISDSSQTTRDRLTEQGLENEDDPNTLILSREITKSGKSQSRVNGYLVTTAILRAVGLDLVDVHGQHEHQSLLLPETHIDLLDHWLGMEVQLLRKSVCETFAEVLKTKKELDQLQRDSRERARDADLYKFQRREIADATLCIDEEQQLALERAKLSNSDRLQAIAEETYQGLSSDAIDIINASISSLSKAINLDPGLSSALDQITEAAAFLEDGITQIRRYRDSLDSEPGRLEVVNDRLDLIHSLTRKYGETIADVLEYGRNLEQMLFALEDSDASEDELSSKLVLLQESIHNLCADLSTKRKQGAKLFSKAIIAELCDLGMSQTIFEVAVDGHHLTAKGSDKVEFLISANPGEPLRPLSKVASGGETSRIMLAIKSVLAQSSYVPTMIFDEIDTGIGGRTGRVLADKLASLSAISQILCITHLPQIASRPVAEHFCIEKSVAGGRTSISVVALNDDQRELEIARMLGGETSQTVIQHAREMLAAK